MVEDDAPRKYIFIFTSVYIIIFHLSVNIVCIFQLMNQIVWDYCINIFLLSKNNFRYRLGIYIFSKIISARPRKPELIISENEPVELPPDVVRGTKMCVVAISVL